MPYAFGKRHLQRGDISILIIYVTWLALFGFSILINILGCCVCICVLVYYFCLYSFVWEVGSIFIMYTEIGSPGYWGSYWFSLYICVSIRIKLWNVLYFFVLGRMGTIGISTSLSPRVSAWWIEIWLVCRSLYQRNWDIWCIITYLDNKGICFFVWSPTWIL